MHRPPLSRPIPIPTPAQARTVLAATFFANGFVAATWVARIPAVKSALALGDGAFGLVLLAAGAGALLAFPAAGYWCARHGSRRVTLAAAVLLVLTLPALALAPTPWGLALALLVYGGAGGAMDVAMNAHGVQVEHGLGRPIFSFLHGMFSLGGLVGAVAGGAAAGAGTTAATHFLATAVVCLVALLWVGPRLLPPAPPGQEESRPAFAWPTRGLFGLGLLAVCGMLGEGSVADWSALYLHEHLRTDSEFAALGYGAFSLAMLAGRFGGDWLTRRLGPVMLLRAGGITAGLGLAGALALDRPAAALMGFAAVGLGLATSVPLVYSAAGRAPGHSPGAALAAVATMGYGSFLAGPPLLGLLAETVTLRGALGFVALVCLGLAALAGRVRTRE